MIRAQRTQKAQKDQRVQKIQKVQKVQKIEHSDGCWKQKAAKWENQDESKLQFPVGRLNILLQRE